MSRRRLLTAVVAGVTAVSVICGMLVIRTLHSGAASSQWSGLSDLRSHVRHVDASLGRSGIVLASPDPSVVPRVSQHEAEAEAARATGGLPPDPVLGSALAVVTFHLAQTGATTCLCWVVDFQGGVSDSGPAGGYHQPHVVSDESFRLTFIDAGTGAEWFNIAVG